MKVVVMACFILATRRNIEIRHPEVAEKSYENFYTVEGKLLTAPRTIVIIPKTMSFWPWDWSARKTEGEAISQVFLVWCF